MYTPLKSAFNGLQFRRWQYGSIFIHLAVIASETREMSRNSKRIWPYSSSRSSKVIDLCVSRKLTCELVTNSDFGPICYRFWDRCLKLENGWIFPPHPCLRPPLGGDLLESRDEIWHQETRIMWLPDGEEIMTLAFFVLIQYRLVTDRRADRLLSQRPALA